MRILQIIDSLEIGGAERMAVNYANALVQEFSFSALATTRTEGALKLKLRPDVSYLFLNKKRTIDFHAAKRVAKFCKANQIEIIQAHSSSYFIAVMSKLFLPNVKIVWHDHYGMSDYLQKRPVVALKIASLFFDGIISVNQLLKEWAQNKLNCKNVIFLANFTLAEEKTSEQSLELAGVDGQRILCLANLRPQKNQMLLLEVAQRLIIKYPEWTIHLVGKDFNDQYSENLRKEIKLRNLQAHVFMYGSTNHSAFAIRQADICVISSISEGLPVAVLEYGFERKAVVSTNVGEIASIICNNKNGYVVPSQDVDAFTFSLEKLIQDPSQREKFGSMLQATIYNHYSATSVITNYKDWLKDL